MGQTSSKNNTDEELKRGKKTLPDLFERNDDEISLKKAFVLSTILHPVAVGVFWLVSVILTLMGIHLLAFDKPDMKPKDIEFVLVTREAPPIDKNTKNRADINSRAGGINDPTKKVSEPSPTPAPQKVASPTPSPKKQAPKKTPEAPNQVVKQPAPNMQQIVKQLAKLPEAPKAPEKPQPLSAPKPTTPTVARPSADIPKPQMPKLSQNPKSPFSVEVPKTTQPVGPAPSYGSGSSKTGGSSSSGGGSTSGSAGTGVPAPKLALKPGSGSGSGTSGSGSRGSQGSSGSGNYGNPSPGNPQGAPGVDAIRQPDWGPYMRELERRIKRNWNPPKGDSSKRVVVYFKIARDGKLLAVNVSRSSGVPLADQAARAAIELTAPFAPLPPEYKGSSIDIDFTFDYNVLGANYR